MEHRLEFINKDETNQVGGEVVHSLAEDYKEGHVVERMHHVVELRLDLTSQLAKDVDHVV
jgi:hypothetical protein